MKLAIVAQRAGNAAGGVFGIPRFHPRAHALFKVGHDLGREACVNILTFCSFCFLHSVPPLKVFFFPKSLGMQASCKVRADPSQGGGAAGVHRQTLDREYGSGKRPERVRGMKEEEKKCVEDVGK